LGYQFNWALYGILSVQIYIYYQARMLDNYLTKSVVYGIYLVETVQTILATHDAWHEFAIDGGSCAGLLALNLNWLSIPIITGFTSATIQCYYAWRIRILSRSNIVAAFIAALAVMQGSAAIAEGITAVTQQDVAKLQAETLKITTVWLGGTAACDVIIASIMVYSLARGRTGFKSTDLILNKLIRATVETGLCTALLATTELVLFLVFKHNFYHTLPSLMLSKLYSNSLLVLLNNR
ncbi:hypothetical protein OBBRIDRAFT_711595, partial [Obba rivulosa]